jgi:hypothetical protein
MVAAYGSGSTLLAAAAATCQGRGLHRNVLILSSESSDGQQSEQRRGEHTRRISVSYLFLPLSPSNLSLFPFLSNHKTHSLLELCGI